MRSLLAAFILAPLAFYAPGEPAEAAARYTLSAGDLRALFPGEFLAVWKDTLTLEIDAGQDGDVRGSSGMLSSSGRWSIRGNQLCLSLGLWSGKIRCGEVIRDGDWYFGFIRSNGRPRLRFRPR